MKLFNKYEIETIKVADPGLKDYINLKPVLVPKTHGRNAKNKFWKSKYNIVERLIGKIMVPGHKGKKHLLSSGHCCGKGTKAYKLVQKTLELIEQITKKNPVEVFVKAIENAAPREEITTIEYGGARYTQSVDCAPQRRVDLALRLMVQGAYSKGFNKKNRYEEWLADEIIKASQSSNKSAAIAKKLELERQADASR
ncbi:MAG: 30S ribosomal protein S7 [Candidatus Woesearchaeota archaeon]|nr:30S ribosomal protein S7 [Candidatus Woesearchaeota archaeon]